MNSKEKLLSSKGIIFVKEDFLEDVFNDKKLEEGTKNKTTNVVDLLKNVKAT